MKFLKNRLLLITGLCTIFFFLGAFIKDELKTISAEDVSHASKIIGMNFTKTETDSMLPLLEDQLKYFKGIDKYYSKIGIVQKPNSIPSALDFDPVPAGKKFDKTKMPFITSDYLGTTMPKNINDLAFYSIGQLAELIRTKKISSVKLTEFFMKRLLTYGETLHCVINYTVNLAMAQAKKADEEIAAGKYRGLLHGIPFGVKDMFYTEKYPTSFGSPPFKEQIVGYNATIVQKLEDAGAILIAKLSLGELAMDDVWFGGKTRCPWDTSKGSSGSSAGPCASVSAGLLPFAIGSETWGSIVSPSTVCGVTGLRPTYGRVSRFGAMALSWSMDKVGPICRNAEDCAIVFNAIYGQDGKDRTLKDLPFNYSPVKSIKGMKIGYFESEFNRQDTVWKKFDEAALSKLKELGAILVPLTIPDLPISDMQIILFAECGAAFDELTRGGGDDQMIQQNKYSWPNIFRASHFIPATEYIQANRLRYLLIGEMEKIMKQVDVCIVPSLTGDNLLMTNLTGHPCTVIPNGFLNEKTPASIVFIGQLYGEAKLLAITKYFQDKGDSHLKHPPMFIK